MASRMDEGEILQDEQHNLLQRQNSLMSFGTETVIWCLVISIFVIFIIVYQF